MHKEVCNGCGRDIFRTPHAGGCAEFAAFLNELGAKKARDKQRAEEFLAEHFIVVSVP